jgi:hypothetical protein
MWRRDPVTICDRIISGDAVQFATLKIRIHQR